MAVTITSYKAYGLYIDEPVTTRAHQVFNMLISEAATDVTMDLAATVAGSLGTFWTSAILSTNGPAALLALQQIQSKLESRICWTAPEIQDPKIQSVGAPASGAYQITTTSAVPSIVFHAAEAPTSVTLNMVFVLAPQQRALRAGML
jgi:hypothetical protein